MTLKFRIACISPGERMISVEQLGERLTEKPGRATGLVAETLVAETRFYRDPFAPLGAPAGNNLLAALGLHALAKSMNLGSLAPVGLECTLGHEK